ncbi:para-nitrobenzyl esterase [Bradyrhizobium diazoefficiens]|uniref:Esterase n=1 Tax=Bradyrhizobium diazoefficiens TaxID=1355477 RepID=A0A810AWC8_9BRAD|nr:carboxylesterase family protein [Bradyrhizobium diazoefficiens]WLA54687.1 carboxylesterase family protein [Bradyrhizobium diazoefficiens]BBZ97214.1 esterase [Bradyrhizobium diazoefficiens]BCA14900.1 esterase [Bradyrhizobium diazoefficiens]BCE59313.1 esterase [Bradyrhizobium diazoefficiens]BCE67995.1 esterase [Bradyrhizobium diazoefficiens]
MRSLLALIVVSAFLCLAGSAMAQPVGQFPFALTREGQMLGGVEGEVAFFKGLAYAAPPVGPLRWRPPEATAESSEMRTAYEYGAACLQPSLPKVSEDCLTLNVFRPFGVDGPLPVMMFIHGGAFVGGTANDPMFDGAKLAQAGLIVVTVNFRLGALGWLTHPALSEDGSGNYGLMDQIAALHWVHDNIAAFGGDPGNVTLFGNGAGATSIALLMLCDEVRGLFQKAILQSVPGRVRLRSRQEAEAWGLQFVATLGPDAKETNARAIGPARLLAAEKKLLAKVPLGFAPTIDGSLVREDIAAGFAAGHEGRIPLIIGSNDDETDFDSEPDIAEALASSGTAVDDLRKLYPDLAKASDLAARFYTDKVFSEPVRLLARLHAASGAPTFRYRFAYVPEARRTNPDGGHGRELQFIFGVEGVPGAGIFSRRDRELASRMRSYWINFARSGDPNGPDLPRWDAAASGDRLLLVTNDRTASGDDPFAERLDRLASESRK